MKLLNEGDEHHLPDASQARQPWYVTLTRKAVTRILSTEGQTISIGVLLSIALTGILSIGYLDVTRNVDRNGISLSDFYANARMEIVDQEATQRKIDRTKQTIPPIYQDARPHNQDIFRALDKLLNDLGALAVNPDMPKEDKYARYLQLTSGKPGSDRFYDEFFTHPISESDWEAISLATKTGMARILKEGFTEADEQLKRPATIQTNIPTNGLKARYKKLVAFMLNATLEPNLILDENAMKRKQEEVAAQISQQPETRTFEEGQKIVGEGDKVSPVQLAALEHMGKLSASNNWAACLGALMLTMLFVFTLWSYLYRFRKRLYFKPSYAALIATLTLITTAFFHLQETGAFGSVPLVAFPLAAIALTLGIFTQPIISVLATTLLVFLLSLTLRADFNSLSILLFGSYMGIYVTGKRINYSDRSKLMLAGFYVGAMNVLVLTATSLLQPIFSTTGQMNGLLTLHLWSPISFGLLAWSFFSGVFSGILTIGSLPLLEALFRLITPYTLMELGNHDQPLLKRMQFEAPGTFHHSLMVATLSEAAAESIGANTLLTRVGCLYHDIGKMKRPLFFIENQAYFGVENPHDKLTPRLSKMVITAHPRDSLEMAKQHKLPQVIMNFMTEHHGTLTAGYFYNKACQEEGAENVNKSQFRYPGPKPASKETAIVMLADACESAVRALKAPTVAQVEERIDKIIQQRIEDGQFDNCPITFEDIYKIKQTFVRVLRGIQHNRIEYQQNMMRELGRKLPVTTISEHAGLQDILQQAQVGSQTGGEQTKHG